MRIVGRPTWWSAWMCEIHAQRRFRTFSRAASGPYKRQSCPKDPSPQSIKTPPLLFESRNKPETLRYFAGMEEPVPRKTSSTSPGFKARRHAGTSPVSVFCSFSGSRGRNRATAEFTSRSSRTFRATSARGTGLVSSPAASRGTSVNRLKLHPGCVNGDFEVSASLAAASANARACASALADAALRGSGKTLASTACRRALTAAAERNTHAEPVASEWTIRWRGWSNAGVFVASDVFV
mmetsp:Transcript_10094/g.42454  ORF Transcript_10094/g.42454 Transcript_10094/m.42454 type:complete len:238 (+) Transcript_10094:1678-2391(+)